MCVWRQQVWQPVCAWWGAGVIEGSRKCIAWGGAGRRTMDDVDAQEREHFIRIVRAFKSYRHYSLKKVTEKEAYIKSLPPHHQMLLRSYLRHLEEQRLCIEHNAEIIKLIVRDVDSMFENQPQPVVEEECLGNTMLVSDIEKVQSTIRQIVRDWSPSGAHERTQCYGPIISKIEELFPQDTVCAEEVSILVPGAGLGRLAYELAKRGYTCQGNEFSLFMLFASNFVLNKCRGVNTLRVYPWVHTGSNLLSNRDQLRPATFPDTNPSDLHTQAQFTMAAGDFLEIYTSASAWDCIATCFFIDCANNIVSFIETIYNILKPGGYWVNLGPLLYHFADQPGEASIEPSFEEVKAIAEGLGFELSVRLSMGGGSLLSWCVRCLGVGTPGQTISQHPLASSQTRIHRTVSTSRGQDSDESEGEEDEEEDDEESFVHKCPPGPATPLLHPPPVPPTVPVRVQPRSVPQHRPVPHSPGQWPPGPCNEAHRDSLDSSPGPASPPASPTTTTSRSNSPASSTCGSQLSLHSQFSQHSRLSALLPPDDNSGQSLGEDRTPKRQIRFMTPEEAARPPQEPPATRVVEFPQSGKSGLARGGDMLRSLFGMEDPVSYAGQYALHGSSKPVKIRSYTTLHAISSYHGRAETSSTPSRYSFGKLELALRYRTSEHMLDVRVNQITQLPPGKKDLKLDLCVSVTPGKKEKWVKGVSAGPRQADDTQAHSGSIKLRKVSKRCLVVSVYQPGLRSHPYLALGHGIVANLGAQPLEEGWQPCTLQLRQGWQVQDHLGMALVALSCCERERGYLTFTVDVLQMKKMKVLRLGSKIASSFKTKVVVQVVAVVVTEGSRTRKEELGGTTLEVPRDSSEKSWEGIFKNTCSHTFSVPKSKVTASCAVLEMHGRARHGVTFSEALLGKVILGPEELFGGEDQGRPMPGAPQSAITVPGDPMDARLTHWGLSIRRKARIEMWHRLQI